MADPLRVLVRGATSGIAEATVRIYAAEGASLLLVGRDEGRLAALADAAGALGARSAEVAILDLAMLNSRATCVFWSKGWAALTISTSPMRSCPSNR
jgi:NADP-dependent 3-hydroxy acid dehydrogenase YdfG